MTINQYVTGEDAMSDQENQNTEKIHVQTLYNPDPDWSDAQPNLCELIENTIMFQNNQFSDYYKSNDLLNQIKHILYNSSGDTLDKYMDIKFVFDKEVERIAKHVAENHETDSFARWAYNEAMKHIT